ncbi:high mobility group (HMG) box domain-containing protein, putative [Eimeria necatrix]|uniref:High mobility group (HMG) box domain-containing protein, putative n=1 Tax=Eimeria necatrix TaxID=51315 RepID=U6MXJ5_9EIME|nr:high mobility group (HMG) box domain-containing protein, putative [Eimeria necatrix]CDJ67219.1 high mobility group (HMG) box domain-containing protein, putative [Eimeria necatrix]
MADAQHTNAPRPQPAAQDSSAAAAAAAAAVGGGSDADTQKQGEEHRRADQQHTAAARAAAASTAAASAAEVAAAAAATAGAPKAQVVAPTEAAAAGTAAAAAEDAQEAHALVGGPQQQETSSSSSSGSDSTCSSSNAARKAAAEETSSSSSNSSSSSSTSDESPSAAAAAAAPEGGGSRRRGSSRRNPYTSSSSSSSSSTSSSSSSSSSVSALEAKQRARLKRQFYLDSDWKTVDFRPQTPETKKSRLFLNSLCYLCEGVITKKSTLGRKAGLGLFCERPEGFAKGAVITEFVGWLVDREQAEQLRKRRKASHIVAVQKGFLYIDGVKDPYYGTGGASFANDGSEFLGGPGNNSYFYHWFDEELGRTRVFLRATRSIANGEEIFVPYDKNYWQDNFEEQEENCPDAFRKRKIEQLQRKYKDFTITSMQDLKARQALVEQQKRLKREKAKEVKRKPLKPNLKRPLSAFMRFSVSRRKELVAANPELRHPKCFKEIAQTISQDWKCLSAKKRAELEQEAAADFNKYKAKLKEWRATHAPKKRKKQRKSVTRTQSTPPAAAGDTCAAEAGDAAVDDSAAQVTGEDGDDKELQSEEKQRQSREAETANAATDVPESADDTRSSSRQSSRLEAPAAAAVADADASKDLKKAAAAAEAACASTVA